MKKKTRAVRIIKKSNTCPCSTFPNLITLRLEDVELLMARRSRALTYETVRKSCLSTVR
jgi:hypothetical protein